MIITGMPRSGTSLVAGILHACGVYVGDYTCGRGNPKGFFENPIWRNACYNVLQRANIVPVGSINQRLDDGDFGIIRIAIARISGGVKGPALVKHPFSLRCWRTINRACPYVLWVITERDPDEALVSAKRFFDFAPGRVCENWVERHQSMIEDLKRHVFHVTVKTSYADRSIDYYCSWVESLGLTPNRKAIESFLS